MARETKAPRLTAQRIVGAARDIAAADGIDAVSMRRLAEDLDVWPMSVYRYFRDKDELIDAVVAGAVADVAAPDPALPWRDQIAALATDVRSALGSGDLAARLPTAALAPGVLALSETGVSILVDAGFAPDEAAPAWLLVLGFAAGQPPAAEARGARSALAGLAEEDYPALTAAAQPYAKALSDSDEAFEYGLQRVLDGLEQRLAESRA